MIFEIDNKWQALGLNPNSTVILQNLGRAGDLIEVVTGSVQPEDSQRGYALAQLSKTYRVSGYEGLIWVRYIRYDISGTITPSDNRICLLDAQEDATITEVSDIPLQLVTGGEISSSSRLKVSSSTRQENQIATGNFYNGISERTAIPANDIYNSVIKAGTDKLLVIEDAIVETDFNIIDSSNYSVKIGAYVDISNGNSWSYTPVAPIPAGRPLNASKVNDFPQATIDLGVPVSSFAGVQDYSLFFAEYYLETQGNRESISTTGTSFFDKGRQIILAPNQELLIRTETGGNSTGTLDLRIIFFLSEIDVADAPGLLGVNI